MTHRDDTADRSTRSTGFLGRLKRSQAGNVLPMMAAAMVPMVGMIGSGLDMSRAYMAKAKLQNACDSTALATRRFMGGNAFDAAARAEGEKFFNFNFPEGTMGTPEIELDIGVDDTDTDVVEVSASTTVPTSMMRVFGKDSMEISVACNADQDFVHNDIMLVLDVTGSMNCRVGTNCSYEASKKTNSRLDALRDAAGALYRALEDADDDIVIRYGFMPYSMTVNVGKTTGFNSNWIRSPGKYHNCTRTNSNGTCRTWGTDADGPSRSSSYWGSSSFSGCIEERSSWSHRTQSEITISGSVSQDDIDAVSTTDAKLKWQEYDSTATVGEYGYYSNLTRFCPTAARKLAEIGSEADFTAAVNAATSQVGGYTNHDLGIMWGMRFLSSTGMFASDNPEERDEMRVDKHLVFLTDGTMTADDYSYSAFGIPDKRDRMTGSGGLVSKHQTRFLNACNRARQMGMTVWVIALDTSSTDISACASGDDHYFEANDGDSLEDAFDTIGKEIGKLRLTR